mmetsp:Transcript_24806/g.37702  ORF Transcript_24806/g.37702 Transcript_24806/m.37702 type:complete len:270 (+) Transcript_24806:95-904(+)|eukprot:CAMPEP_0178915418 /NCGR_PEP_ID=MMETSP0786-20121207/12018_1 /TAXON_ID=186022 /ORGANISM="Thalassionema frauenfeldii, Strain CCMP 1798" /LENGTH=269 /DNA_ID=CAMNT_0020588531 /DNA_START=77 /DNA_END=886 /DNA_ORIENTATION=-
MIFRPVLTTLPAAAFYSFRAVPQTTLFGLPTRPSAAATIESTNMPSGPELEAPIYSWHLHAVWRSVDDGGRSDDEDVILSLLREFITTHISYFQNPNVEDQIKGHTAKRNLVGAGNPLLAMEEVIRLEDKPIISSEGEVIQNPRGPFYWIADKQFPDVPIHIGEFGLHIPVVEDKTGMLLDLTTRWWRRRVQETAKERGCDTLTLLLHPNTGQLYDDHTSWLVWFDSDFRYTFMPAVGSKSVFNEGRAQYYLENRGPYLKTEGGEANEQ